MDIIFSEVHVLNVIYCSKDKIGNLLKNVNNTLGNFKN